LWISVSNGFPIKGLNCTQDGYEDFKGETNYQSSRLVKLKKII